MSECAAYVEINPVPQTILVIDDVPIARTFNASALRAAGFEVVEADDGQLALAMLPNQAIDAIVCDFQMPNMNGVELVQAVRSQAQYQRIPILMLSAEGNAQTMKSATDAGATAWVLKPVSRSQLVATVNRLLHNAGT